MSIVGGEPGSQLLTVTDSHQTRIGDAQRHGFTSKRDQRATCPATTTSDKSDDDNNGLAIVAIVVGGVALLTAVGAIAAGRRRVPAAPRS